jgi:cytochrome c biogenesis protein ResB
MNVTDQRDDVTRRIMRVLKRAWYYWGRTSVATWLLVLLAVLAALGSLFPQVPSGPADRAAWLTAAEDKYGPLARVLGALKLFAFFRSPWFWVPAGGLALSLLICTLIRLRPVWRSGAGRRRVPTLEELSHYPLRAHLSAPSAEGGLAAARAALRAGRFRPVEVSAGEQPRWLGERNRLARLGTLATHLAPLVLLIGAMVSGLTGWREDVALFLPGDAVSVGPAGSWRLRLLDGQVDSYPDGSPSDYRVTLEVVPEDGAARERLLRLNHPVRHAGVSLLLAEYVEVGDSRGVRLLAVRDFGYPVVIAAGVLLMIGVCLTSYLPHQQVWLWAAADGTIELAGRTSGDGVGYERLFGKVVECIRQAMGVEAGSKE